MSGEPDGTRARGLRITRAEVAGLGLCDVRVAEGRIVEISERLDAAPGEVVLDANGGALLPGLHDHHLHLFAMAAAMSSLACGPPEVGSERELAAALAQARPAHDGWIRGVGHHERVTGPLDRDRLDAFRGDVPIRVQHRTGALWVVNSAGLAALGIREAADGEPEGLERDSAGRATGRLFRCDTWLRDRLGATEPELNGVGETLARAGVTGVTDASPDNGPETVAQIEASQRNGALPQAVHWMGALSLPAPPDDGSLRWHKIVLDERVLPTPQSLVPRVAAAHRLGRPVAIHCVTRAELVVACAALEEAGVHAGDRIEHASVAPPDAVEWLAGLGVGVVTQPGFLYERGDRYLVDVDTRDRGWLYRCAGFDVAGVALGGGTDAPYGVADPWRAMQAAVDRRTAAAAVIGREESVSPERALALFTTAPAAPGGAPRRVDVGAPADLCLLDLPWGRARELLSRDRVRATLRRGVPIFDAAS